MVLCAIHAGCYRPGGRDQKPQGTSGFGKSLGQKKKSIIICC